jgi:tetratricopeptide (TPR) repeat protein
VAWVVGGVGARLLGVVDEVFVGRRDELARFAALLRELAGAGVVRSGGLGRRRHSGGNPAGAAKSRVVLVYGLGGSGKSRLLRHCLDMAHGRAPGSPVPAGKVETVWLDWEDERRDDPGGYAGMAGPSLVTVLDAVQQAVKAAVGDSRAGPAFGNYRRGAARMPEYAARFAAVVAQSRQAGSPFTAEDAAALGKAAASAGLLAAGHPGGLLGLTPGQLAAVGQAGGHLSEAAARAVTGKKPGEISPQEYDLVTDPARELARRAAAALRMVAGRRPLVVFLDTGEVIGGRAWGWLRRVMAETGPRVVWVVGGRFETEAEAGAESTVARFVRQIGDEFLVRMSPARFDDEMIRIYLEARPNAPSYTDKQIDGVARFTRGLPLAVSFTATLLDAGYAVEDVCQEVSEGRPTSIVSQLARRYLVHAERQNYSADEPRRGDVTRILGLALAFGDLRNDPELLAALWNVKDPLAAFQDLASRHDFVLPVSRRLHDDVRATLRTDLLDPWRRTVARDINERALALYRGRLGEMRVRWPTLDEQLAHTRFATTLLAVLWHTVWADNQAGLDLFTEVLPVLAVGDPLTSDAAAVMMDQFVGTFDEDQRRDLDLLTRFGVATSDGMVLLSADENWEDARNMVARALRPARRVEITTAGLALEPSRQALGEPLIGEPADRDVAVMILRAHLQARDHDQQTAIATLRAAAAQTTSTCFKRAIGSRAEVMAVRLIWAGPQRTFVPAAPGLAAAKLATQMLPGRPSPWQHYAAALASLGRFEEALAAYDQALTLDPDDATVQNNRGTALASLGRFEEALAAYDQAVTLDSHDATFQNNRGTALASLGRFEEAMTAYDQALTLDPDYAYAHIDRGIALTVTGDFGQALVEFDTAGRLAPGGAGEGRVWAGAILWHRADPAGARDRFALVQGRVTGCTPFHTAEMEAVALCGLDRPNDAEQHLRRALPKRAAGDAPEIRAIFVLLSDPPLPGIKRLRAIIENET